MSKFQKMGRIALLAGVFLGASAAKGAPPEKLKVSSVGQLYGRFDQIPASDRAAFGKHVLEARSSLLNEASQVATFEKFLPEEQARLARQIFEATRLAGALINGGLHNFKDLLSPEQKKGLSICLDLLQKKGIVLKDEAALSLWMLKTRSSQDGDKILKKTYRQLVELLAEQEGMSEKKEVAAEATTKAAEVTPSAPFPAEKKVTVKSQEAPVTSLKRELHGGKKQNKYLQWEWAQAKRFSGTFLVEGTVLEHEGKPTINLTFDDGPDAKYTLQILAILAKYHVRATFYVQGMFVKAYPAIMRQIVEGGHEIALHSYDHTLMPSIRDPERAYADQVERVNNQLAKQGLPTSKLFRPPEGAITDKEIQTLGTHGFKVINWTIDTNDWQKPSSTELERRVVDNACAGAIVLMHSGGGDRSRTVAALPGIIEKLQGGFSFVTTSQILGLEPIPKQEEPSASEATSPTDGEEEGDHDHEEGSVPSPNLKEEQKLSDAGVDGGAGWEPNPRPSLNAWNDGGVARERAMIEEFSLKNYHDAAELRAAKKRGEIVKLDPRLDDGFVLDDDIGELEKDPSTRELYSYLRTEAFEQFKELISKKFAKAFPGFRLLVGSATRSEQYIDLMRKVYKNTAKGYTSSHLSGLALDVKIRVVPKNKSVSEAEPMNSKQKAWMRAELLDLEKRGLVEATQEHGKTAQVFHMCFVPQRPNTGEVAKQ